MRPFSDRHLVRDLPGEWNEAAQRVDPIAYGEYIAAAEAYDRMWEQLDPDLPLTKRIEKLGAADRAFSEMAEKFAILAHSFPEGSQWRTLFLEALHTSLWQRMRLTDEGS